VGIIDTTDRSFIRVTRKGLPNLFIFKTISIPSRKSAEAGGAPSPG